MQMIDAIIDAGALKNAVEAALELSTAHDKVARVVAAREGATRYANSAITQNVARADAELFVQVAYDSQVGRAATNRLDRGSIAACVARAEAMARVAPPDPEYMPPVRQAPITWADSAFPATAAHTPADRAEAIRRAVGVAAREGMSGAGVFNTRGSAAVVGNSAGHMVYYPSTDAYMTCSATAADSVGWAMGRVHDIGQLDAEAVARRAVEKARAGRHPRDLPPGRYDVILEPAAVAELLFYHFFHEMDAKATDEGRTFLTGKKGTRIAAPAVTVFSDPALPACPSRPFTDEGLPLHRVDWIRGGVLENLMYSRYWAKRQGVRPTGTPSNLVLAGGESAVEDLIRATRRGLLVTRFWYIRAVEPMRDLFTGMTRDGTFLVENGEVVGPVKNLRFNESVVRLLEHVERLGPQKVAGEYMWMLMPYLQAREFNFTSATRF